MSLEPIITAIIPTYRRPKLLQRAIRSVLNQTYPHLQVCVYDNCSGDETASVVAEIAKTDSRVKYYCHPENIGAPSNFNYGMMQVATPYFSFLSDDDMLLPDFYQLAIDKLSYYKDAVFFSGITIHVDSNESPVGISPSGYKEGIYSPPKGLLTMWEKGQPQWTGILFRREVIDRFGELTFGFLCDLEFELRIACSAPFYQSLVPVALFIQGDNTASSHLKLLDIWPSMEILGERYFTDKRLSSEVRERIYLAWRRKVQGSLLRIAANSIVSERPMECSDALRVYNQYFGLSQKSVELFILSKMANFNNILAVITAKMLRFRRRVNLKKKSAKSRKELISLGFSGVNLFSQVKVLEHIQKNVPSSKRSTS